MSKEAFPNSEQPFRDAFALPDPAPAGRREGFERTSIPGGWSIIDEIKKPSLLFVSSQLAISHAETGFKRNDVLDNAWAPLFPSRHDA